MFCGLGGWADGLLAEGWNVIGFDIERHEHGEHRYPAQLVVQDVLTLHGSQFEHASLIVASPPCQEYSYMAMPWKKAKAKAKAIHADDTGKMLADLNRLFDACFRIQKEASVAAGHRIPLVVENVRGAIPWVGRSRWNFGSFHLWGDVPALMPATLKTGRKNGGGSWFAVAHNTTSGHSNNPVNDAGRKVSGHPNIRDGHAHTKHLTNPGEHDGLKRPGIKLSEVGFNVSMARSVAPSLKDAKYERTAEDKRQHLGINRKAASAMIAKIPLPLSRHIAATFRCSKSE